MKLKVIFLFCIAFIFLLTPLVLNAYADEPEPVITTPGDFDTPRQIIRYNNQLLVVDSGSTNPYKTKVQIADLSLTQAKNIGPVGGSTGYLSNPTLIACADNEIFVFMTISPGVNWIKVFNFNGKEQRYYSNYKDTDSTNKILGNFSSMITDSFGNIYCTDYTNNKLIKLTKTGFEALDINLSAGLLKSESKILTSSNTSNLIIVDSTSVSVVDLTNSKINTYASINAFTDVTLDYQDNLYFYNAATYKINMRTAADNYLNASTEVGDLNGILTAPATSFTFHQISGIAYFVTNNGIESVDLSGIINNLDDFVKTPDYLDANFNTSSIEVALLKQTASVYEYPYAISPLFDLATGKHVFILGEENNYYYCLITTEAEYNITGYIQKNNLIKVNHDANVLTNKKLIVYFEAQIYKYPSSLLAYNGAQSPLVSDTFIKVGKKLEATRLLNYVDNSNFAFYEIELENGTFGYVKTSNLMTYNLKTNSNKIVTNAQISITDHKAFVELYTKAGDKYQLKPTELLMDSTRIKVVGNYDKNAKYTLIEYVDNNGTVQSIYIKTEYILLDGIQTEILLGIVLTVIASILGIILIVVARKKNR